MAARDRRAGRRAGSARRLILCSGTLGDVPFDVKAHAAAAAGFEGISIYAREHGPGVRALLDDLGLAVAEVDGASAWLPGQPGPPFAHMVEVAVDLGARSITVLEVTGEAPDPALARDAFAAASERAAEAGVTVHLEPFAWSGIATLAAAVTVVGEAGGVLLDVCHHVLGPDAGVLPAGAAARIVAVQVADPGPARMHRSLPGPVTACVLATLPPGLPLEVEVFGLGGAPFDAARSCRAAMEDLLGG